MLKMVHGSSGESLLWPMVRYAQAGGNDVVCSAILMAHLNEPICDDIETLCQQYDGITNDPRDVGRHGKAVAQLLNLRKQQGDELTLPQLVSEWRSRSPLKPVEDYPPKGLSAEDCERIVIALVVEEVFEPNVVWTAYDSIVYLRLGRRGVALLHSPDPKIIIRFPIRDDAKSTSTQNTARKSITGEGEWLTTKTTAGRKKKVTSKRTTTKKPPVKKKAPAKKSNVAKAPPKPQRKAAKKRTSELIELSSDESDVNAEADDLMSDQESDDELEFE
jgi:hypothetical protein